MSKKRPPKYLSMAERIALAEAEAAARRREIEAGRLVESPWYRAGLPEWAKNLLVVVGACGVLGYILYLVVSPLLTR